MKSFLDHLTGGFGLALGIVLFLYLFGWAFNSLEKYFLSQNCERYFETLKEQNLVPHRCYKD